MTVHLEEGRCFDAEIHLDELEDVVGGPFKEDQKGAFESSSSILSQPRRAADSSSFSLTVSVGKLILANLFSGEPLSTRSFRPFFPSLTSSRSFFFLQVSSKPNSVDNDPLLPPLQPPPPSPQPAQQESSDTQLQPSSLFTTLSTLQPNSDLPLPPLSLQPQEESWSSLLQL